MYTIVKEFNMSCSHQLSKKEYSDEQNKKIFGKCVNNHGHNYKIEVSLSSETLIDGMIINFSELKEVFKKKIDDKFDHAYLNDLMDTIATAENMAKLFFDMLAKELNNERVFVSQVKIWETPTSSAIYRI